MLASQRPPTAGLDNTAFQRGRLEKRSNWHKADKDTAEDYLAIAKRAGVDTHAADYYSAIAERPGDPNAWCKSLDEVKEKCKAKGWACKVKGGVLQVDTQGRVGTAYRRKKTRQKKAKEKKNGS